MCTLMAFPFCAVLCSSSIRHITLTPVSLQSSLWSFITMSLKRWLGSLECHGNAVPLCVRIHIHIHSCMCICWCVCVWLTACVYVHSCMLFSILGSLVFFLFFFSPSQKIWRCVAAVTERDKTEQVDREEWRRSQEELSSSNRQRAKRMTVPSSSLSVNMIIFEPSLRSKACHTTCKMVTKGSQVETHSAACEGSDRAKLALH